MKFEHNTVYAKMFNDEIDIGHSPTKVKVTARSLKMFFIYHKALCHILVRRKQAWLFNRIITLNKIAFVILEFHIPALEHASVCFFHVHQHHIMKVKVLCKCTEIIICCKLLVTRLLFDILTY